MDRERSLQEQKEWYRRQALEYARRAEPAAGPVETAPQDEEDQGEDYQEFLKNHPGRGKLKVQVTAARGVLPVSEASVEIVRREGDSTLVLDRVQTDEDGIADGILLPARPASYAQSSETAQESGTSYEVSVTHPSFVQKERLPVTIFEGVETILPVGMWPALK